MSDEKRIFEMSAEISRLLVDQTDKIWDDLETELGTGEDADSVMLNIAGNFFSQTVARAAGTARGRKYTQEESKPLRDKVKKMLGNVLEKVMNEVSGEDYGLERRSAPPES